MISNYLMYMTKICWRTIDAHSQNVAVTVSLSFVPKKASNKVVMWICDWIDL